MKEVVIILAGILFASWMAYSIILAFELVILILSEFLKAVIAIKRLKEEG